MADKRINALANTAPSTASDDFIAVDGTTNGTRKLNAFSPTFGGNATVTGTLTVNGATASTIAGGVNVTLQVGNTSAEQRAVIGCTRRLNYGDVLFGRNLQGKSASDNYTAVATSAGTGFGGFEVQDGGVARVLVGTGATTAGADVTPTVALSASTSAVSIPLTTASTTTSTGALVVGNGTSGGLGVGGAANIGGTLSVADGGTVSSAGTVRLANNTSIGWRNAANSADIFLTVNNSNIFAFGSGAPVYVNNTTASTSTSSGALVVSGGVGVAKNASIGVNNSTGVLRVCDNSFGSDYVVLTTAGTDGTGTYGLFISQASGTGLNAPTGQVASLRVNNAAIVSANSAGPILQLTGTAPTLTGNSSLTFEFTSNTSLTLIMRGSDGVTRSASITFS